MLVRGAEPALACEMKRPAEFAGLGVDSCVLIRFCTNKSAALLHIRRAIASCKVGVESSIKTGVQTQRSGDRFLSGTRRRQNLCCFGSANLTDKNVAPANLASMGLKQNLTFRRERLCSIPIILHHVAIDDELVVQPNPRLGPDLANPKPIPLAKRRIGKHVRFASRAAALIVVQRTGAQVRLAVLALGIEKLIPVPDLDLRIAAKVNPTVSPSDGFVFDEQFHVAQVFIRVGVGPVAVVDQLPVFDRPMFAKIRALLGEMGLAFFASQLGAGMWIQAMPAGKVLAVKKGTEPLGRIGLGGVGCGRGKRK